MNEFQWYLAEEFAEDYQEGRLSRPDAIRVILKITGSMAVTDSILAASVPRYAGSHPGVPVTGLSDLDPGMPPGGSQKIQPPIQSLHPSSEAPGTKPPANANRSVKAIPIEFPGMDQAILHAYLAKPEGEGSFPVVLVCHENRGLTDHIRDVTRRFALAGYVALAVDLLSRRGGSGALDPGDVPGELANIAPDQFTQDFRSGWEFLKGQAFAQASRVGMVGFCFGGGVTWRIATGMPELRAAVPFYGPPPRIEDIPKIQAAVLAIYGEKDARITQTAPAIQDAMRKNNKIFEKVIYPDADHAFFNDTGTRYHPQAARDAWNRTLAWFQRYLS
jgi:carboxymethylenebutenolidase